jgi:geranylgeranyl pyrophosphate synthase/predicted secreted hydrolase
MNNKQTPLINECSQLTVDESPQTKVPIEWWFVQGTLRGDDIPLHYFMVSFFRYRQELPAECSEYSHSLLISLLDSQSSQHYSHTRIDRQALTWGIKKADEYQGVNVEPSLLKDFKAGLLRGTPPQPIILSPQAVEISAKPLGITWEDFQFNQIKTGFELTFSEPGNGRMCCLKLFPNTPRRDLKLNQHTVWQADATCFSYPRVKLQGTLADQPVNGEAWIDHQWGDTASHLHESGQRLIGWDWFAFNLSNGTDGVIWICRDAETGRCLSKCATWWSVDGTEFHDPEVILKPLQQWQSTASWIRYPLEWQIDMAAMGISLRFSPIANDQEVAVFDIHRAVWEGAGRIEGTWNGQPVSGSARGEFYGYGGITDFSHYVDRVSETVQICMETLLPLRLSADGFRQLVGPTAWSYELNAYEETIAKPIWDLIKRKGKFWRPMFCLLMLETLGKSSAPYIDLLALPVELAHTGSLIVDDVEDDSRIRRGGPCIHVQYGTDVAVNAGNLLYFLPLLLVERHPLLSQEQKLELHFIATRHYVRAHFGQAADIYWSGHMTAAALSDWLTDDYAGNIFQTYAYKTGSAVSSATECAAVIAESSQFIRREAVRFATDFGVAFQIIDDVLNFSDSPDWRKTCGEDLAAGKLTYVIYQALRQLPDPGRQELFNIITSPARRTCTADLETGIQLIRSSGALEICAQEGTAMFEQAWERFSDNIPSSWPKWMLHLLCLRLTALAHDV